MKIVITLAIALTIAIIGAVGVVYSGLYNVSASSSDSGLIDWLLSTTSHASIERRAIGIDVPNLDDEALLRAGINDFSAMCAGCHGAPGQRPAAVGQGLNPRPPNLAESAQYMTSAELFWVTKYGIRMTGMPAWGITHDDAALWPVIAFLKRLPELDESGYQTLLAGARGSGHHTSADGEVYSHSKGESVPSTLGQVPHQPAGAVDQDAKARVTGEEHHDDDHHQPH